MGFNWKNQTGVVVAMSETNQKPSLGDRHYLVIPPRENTKIEKHVYVSIVVL